MSQEIIPCLSYPTTIIYVDDDSKALERMEIMIGREFMLRTFKNPKEALKFLKEIYNVELFTDRCISKSEDQSSDKRSFEINFRAIRQEVQNAHRFEEIAVVILDFAMPGMNGGELAEQLSGLPFKIILLTGEADANVALELFNKRIIHNYIRKDDLNFNTSLDQMIKNLQNKYFEDLSAIEINSLNSPSYPHFWYKDPAFKAALDQFCRENNIVEYYLLDEFGSYLLIDTKGNQSWYAVTNEEMMQTYLHYAEGDHAPASIVEGIKTRRMMPFFYSDDDFNVRPAEWKKYLHPAKTLQGQETYYYTYITDLKAYDVDGKVYSYEEFLHAQG